MKLNIFEVDFKEIGFDASSLLVSKNYEKQKNVCGYL